MNRYQELRARQQKEFNAFPIHFAFGAEQTEKKFEELGITSENAKEKIVLVGAGGFIMKSDKDAFLEMVKRHREELDNAISNDETGEGFIYEMFLYELRNHEYGYTGETEDTLDSLGYTYDDIERDSRLSAGLKKAMRTIEKQEE